jgi:hypothetical protein
MLLILVINNVFLSITQERTLTELYRKTFVFVNDIQFTHGNIYFIKQTGR